MCVCMYVCMHDVCIEKQHITSRVGMHVGMYIPVFIEKQNITSQVGMHIKICIHVYIYVYIYIYIYIHVRVHLYAKRMHVDM
jgi:hypothetical protein